MNLVEYGTEVDHSQVRGEICFLKEVERMPVFPGPRGKPKEITKGVWEQSFLTDPMSDGLEIHDTNTESGTT